MKRLVFVGIAVVAVAASVVSTTSAARARSLDLVLTPSVAPGNANSCCVVESDLAGTATIPSLGRVDYAGVYDLIVHYDPELVMPPQLSSHLFLTFTAANGDTFEVAADSDAFDFGDDPPAPWEIIDATGRFSGLSGSGIYTVTGLDTNALAFSVAPTLSFTGTIN